MTFRDFTTQDYLEHPTFRKWVLDQDEAAAAFWNNWLQSNPDKESDVVKAKEILLLIAAPTYKPAANDEKETWEKVLWSMDRFGTKVVDLPHGPRRRWLPYAAAIFIGLLIATSAAFLFYPKAEVHHQTAMGELRTIELPDHSIVKLNVNSKIHYKDNWDKTHPREVWVDGEAFFSVTHQSNNRTFVVHTKDVDIQVVGTEFNVNTRRIKTQVVLTTGMVKLTLNKKRNQPVITMKPGDMVVYSAATTELVNKKVDPEVYSSWKQKVLSFNETPIAEVIKSLQDNMGITIQLEDSSFSGQTFTGSIPMDNIDVFFKTLSRSFEVHIDKTGTNTYKISNN
ncbi:DUF4974 domain-containing protein [Chitinophaga sp. SYP-B3965]|uniref:FecR family protein n=1 Tax=Chitinophaga sp. SYP-B3965 TaxID=2663120 RepID=UPI00129965DE|nr:FecR domain-containing protein [Chitinophaga sp. SYP-B3965]MRG43774.1 DUF4974 domain-containing protein [Chitinophaga sp. SYP-B3965]